MPGRPSRSRRRLASPPAGGVAAHAGCPTQRTWCRRSGRFAVNPLYFKYQLANGRTYDTLDGNAAFAGFEPQLASETLSAGQSTRGYVAFDVPAGGRLIQLTDPLFSTVGQWRF